MNSLMFLLTENLTIHVSNYAVRPGKLFTGVDMNLSIIIASNENNENYTLSTRYNRWYELQRENLFKNIKYQKIIMDQKACALPKIKKAIEGNILEKIKSLDSLDDILFKGKKDTLYYHSGGRYFRKCIRKKLSNEYKELIVDNESSGSIICLLSSSFYYWFWIVMSDCYHVTKKDVGIIPVPKTIFSDSDLTSLSIMLLEDLDNNAEVRLRKRADGSEQKEVNFYIGKSKPLIDEIDRVLARHYGFTDEELDFIINYDIKYRMGAEDEDGEE
jgi:hypothetical protein